MKLSREDIALRLVCAAIQYGRTALADIGENELTSAFMIARTFEEVSDRIGGRPLRGTVKGEFVRHPHLEEDDD